MDFIPDWNTGFSMIRWKWESDLSCELLEKLTTLQTQDIPPQVSCVSLRGIIMSGIAGGLHGKDQLDVPVWLRL